MARTIKRLGYRAQQLDALRAMMQDPNFAPVAQIGLDPARYSGIRSVPAMPPALPLQDCPSGRSKARPGMFRMLSWADIFAKLIPLNQ
jgi:hypothetical protein